MVINADQITCDSVGLVEAIISIFVTSTKNINFYNFLDNLTIYKKLY
jgi:hypothetical protein